MFIFLYGEDTYRSSQKLKEIKDRFKREKDPAGINITTLDGENFTLEKFNNVATQSGFLVNKRLIITKNLLTAKPLKETIDALIELLTNLKDSDNVFVFWENGEPEQKNPLLKFLSKNAKYRQIFFPLTTGRLTAWLKNYLKKNGGKIETPALDLLIAFVGNDLWQLTNELDKLFAFAKDKTITAIDVQELVQAKLNENIFGLADAIADGNQAVATRLLNEQLALGLNETYILFMIIRQFRMLVKLKSLVEQNLTPVEIVKKTGWKLFVVKKILPASKKISLDKLKTIYQKLVKLEQKFKSTSLPKQVLLDLFIIEI